MPRDKARKKRIEERNNNINEILSKIKEYKKHLFYKEQEQEHDEYVDIMEQKCGIDCHYCTSNEIKNMKQQIISLEEQLEELKKKTH